MGDPAGIGPDITIEAWRWRIEERVPPFAVFGDPDVYSARAALLDIRCPIAEVSEIGEAAADAFADALPILPVRVAQSVQPGRPDSGNAPAVVASIDAAVSAVSAGHATAVVTNPIAKSVLYAAGFSAPGHTEYLAQLSAKHWPGHQRRAVMMLVCETLRVVPLTIHVPLSRVPGLISQESIVSTVQIMAESLETAFGISTPRISVCGLNPHAGEDGAIGLEDCSVIAPAIEALRSEGIDVSGPHSADTLFHERARASYEAVLAMYHDQALLPIKTIDFDSGVNTTLGLPFVRTSPDHGTAFSLAGKRQACADSLRAALRLADKMAERRFGAMP